MDTTLAISEAGANRLLQYLVTLASVSGSDTATFGPFQVGYSASVTASGGSVTLIDAPANRVRLNNVNVAGNVSAFVRFDLGLILPRICIPPFRVCIRIPFIGRVCTPQVCIPWPNITVPVSFPFSVNASAEFALQVQSRPAEWALVLVIFPFSLSVDLSPTGPLIIAAIQNAVRDRLDDIPLVGGLLGDLVATVIGAFSGVLSGILGVISGFLNGLIALLNLFNVAIPLELRRFPKTLTVLDAHVPIFGDPPLQLTVSGLTSEIRDREIVAEATLA